jgi:hypothetical protein
MTINFKKVTALLILSYMKQKVAAVMPSTTEHWDSIQARQEQDTVSELEVVQSISNPEILFNIIASSICLLTLLALITSSEFVSIMNIFVLSIHLYFSSKSYLHKYTYEFFISPKIRVCF